MSIYRVLGGIYISGIDGLTSGIDLKEKYGIESILSVVEGSISPEHVSRYTHMQIEVTDEETTNILQYLDQACSFIDEGLHKNGTVEGLPNKHTGGVLVHCAQGVSRSVTAVMAYLMKNYKLTYDQSLHAVRRKNRHAEPNPSFAEQLKLYKQLGFSIDTSSQTYKQFLISLNLKLDPSGSSLRDLCLLDMSPSEHEQVASVSTSTESDIRCKRCRQTLARTDQLEGHEQPESSSKQASFVKHAPNSRRIVSASDGSHVCSHYFLSEPLTWMRDELFNKAEIEGKFMCPKCNSKVGGYSWKGSRCSCGKWVVPAIHLQTAKVDSIKSS